MARKDEEKPEAPVEEVETPTGDVTLETGAEGADLASAARSPELTNPAGGATEEPAAQASAEDLTEAATEEGAEAPAEPEIKRYRPTEDYAVGDRIRHHVWDAVGVVTHRDTEEQIFRIPINRMEERGRCRLIRVEFEKEVPASGGPRREVTLIADWHGRAFEVGATQPRPVAATEELLPVEETELVEEPVAPRAKVPALPEIPEPDEVDMGEFGDEAAEDQETEPVGS